jgi:hypothetical protein
MMTGVSIGALFGSEAIANKVQPPHHQEFGLNYGSCCFELGQTLDSLFECYGSIVFWVP